jgi:transposase
LNTQDKKHITVFSKVQIKAVLLLFRSKIPPEHDTRSWTISFLTWFDGLKFFEITGDFALHSKVRIYKCLEQEYRNVANQMRDYCRKNHKIDYYLLKSIPELIKSEQLFQPANVASNY